MILITNLSYTYIFFPQCLAKVNQQITVMKNIKTKINKEGLNLLTNKNYQNTTGNQTHMMFWKETLVCSSIKFKFNFLSYVNKNMSASCQMIVNAFSFQTMLFLNFFEVIVFGL